VSVGVQNPLNLGFFGNIEKSLSNNFFIPTPNLSALGKNDLDM
jgi:hypothetical protein